MADPRRTPGRQTPEASTAGTGDPVDLRAVKLIGGGRTLAHSDGATWMVQGGLPGELLRVRMTRKRARIIEANTMEVLNDRHPARLEFPCLHSDACGGCDWPHVDPQPGSLLKRDVATEAAARFPEIANLLREAPVKDSPPGYRLRNRLHWDPRRKKLGFYGPRSWQVAEITECRIISPSLTRIMPSLKSALGDRCPQPVDVEILDGSDGVVAALLAARGGPRQISNEWLPTSRSCPGISGFHRLDRSSTLIPGWGRDHVRMDLPIELEVPIGAFFQGNRHLIGWLFERVAALIGPGDEPIYDLHGGVGFLAAAASWAGRSAITLVEVHPPAAAAAQRNLPTAEVSPTTAESFLNAREQLPSSSVVITDPPRSGMTRELRSRIVKWRPDRILMLGCDPATWSRDAGEFMDHGYVMRHIEVVDLFPFTHHVEILAVLEST